MVLVICEVVNIALSTMIASAVSREWEQSAADSRFHSIIHSLFPNAPGWALQSLAGTLITWPIVLLLCEITPKVIAARASQLVATLSSGPLTIAYDFFKPVRATLTGFLDLLSRTLGNKEGGGYPLREQMLREEEFLSMLEEGHKEGDIQESEMELIRNVFDLDDTQVSEIMVPLDKVLALPMNTPVKQALSSLPTRQFSRIPIVGANKKSIVGVLYSKDLLLARLEGDAEALNGTVAVLMRKPMVVQPTLRVNGLFLRMKKQKMHMAIVENQGGEAIGVVTMNDVLEALFEDLIPDDEDELEQIAVRRGTP